MTVKERIAAIRIADKIERNAEYSERIGVSATVKTVKIEKLRVHSAINMDEKLSVTN